jgi:hypothetical protein
LIALNSVGITLPVQLKLIAFLSAMITTAEECRVPISKKITVTTTETVNGILMHTYVTTWIVHLHAALSTARISATLKHAILTVTQVIAK